MAVFPESPVPSQPMVWSPSFSTILAGPYPAGTTVRRKGRLRPLHSATLKYGSLNRAATKIIYDFFCARGGRFEAFTFFDFMGWDLSPTGIPWGPIYAGIGTGGVTQIDLPAKSVTSLTVFDGGSPKSGTLVSGGGLDGRDRFTPSSAWSSGGLITASFTVRRAYKSVFDADEMPLTEMSVALTQAGIKLVEVP